MNKNTLFPIFILVLTFIYFIWIPLSSTKYLTGPDSPFYLIQIEKIINGNLGEVFNNYPDRIFTFITQSILLLVLGTSAVTSIKIWIIVVTILQVITYYLMVEKMFNRKMALLSTFILSLWAAFYRLSWDLYSNFLAILLFSIILYVYFAKVKYSSGGKFIFLGFLSGLLMYTHNLSAFTFLFLIFIPFGIFTSFRLFIEKITALSVLLKNWSLYFISWFFVSWLSLRAWFFPTIFNIYKLLINKFFGHNYNITYAWSTNIYSLNNDNVNFPFNLTAFSLFLQKELLFISFLGLIILIFKKNKNIIEMFVIWWTVILILLTQQEFFGFQWISDRNVLLLAWPLSICGSVTFLILYNFMRKYIRNNIITNLTLTVLVTFLILNPLNKLLESTNFMRANEKTNIEFDFLNTVDNFIEDNSIVVTTNVRHFWTEYFINKAKVEPGEYYLICGNLEVKERLNAKWIEHSYFLSKDSKAGDVYEMVKKEEDIEGRKIYIIINPDDGCVDVDKFTDTNYFTLVYEDYLRLYSIRENENET